MEYFEDQSKEQLIALEEQLEEQLKKYQGMGLQLNMARGKPCTEQLDLSNPMTTLQLDYNVGPDYRNYGLVDGIPGIKKLFADLMDISEDEVIVGGNASLNLMYDCVTKAMLLGTKDSDRPWSKESAIKFICPVPGYDRHFGICEALGIEMINVPMTDQGPEMDIVEELVSKDPLIKGIWCVPKYSNPTGITYSDEVVDRLATMSCAAKDFRIFWDNAYMVHHLNDHPDILKNIMEVAKEAKTEDRIYMFGSTSKVTFPGAGISFMAMSKANVDFLLSQIKYQTIGPNKVNEYNHLRFLPNVDAVEEHMKKQAAIIGPKFKAVLDVLRTELGHTKFAKWTEPNGGYFVSLDIMPGCAKETVELCKKLGVTLTPAGAPFPYGKDPEDKNIRIAPTYPAINEVSQAIEVLCACAKKTAVTKLLASL